jgi:hypothetical protein
MGPEGSMSYEALSKAVTATFILGVVVLAAVILLAVFDPSFPHGTKTTVTVRASGHTWRCTH